MEGARLDFNNNLAEHDTLVLVSLLNSNNLDRLYSVDWLGNNLLLVRVVCLPMLRQQLNGDFWLLSARHLLSGNLLFHHTPVLYGLVYSLILTVLYLADRSRTMNLLYGLTGSLVLTVLYLADRSKIMDLLCRLTGSLFLTVLYLADRSRFMNLLCGLTGSLVLTVLYWGDKSKIMDLK